MRISDWSSDVCSSDLRSGRGVAIASTYLVEKDLANGTLVELQLPGGRQVTPGGYYFVTREDRWTSPAIAKLRQFLQAQVNIRARSEEHTSELQSLMRISYAVFCLKKKKNKS